MNHLSKFLKLFLAIVMLGMHLVAPLTVSAFELTENQGTDSENFETLYNDEFEDNSILDLETMDSLDLETIEYSDAENEESSSIVDIEESFPAMDTEELFPAVDTSDLPELLFADQTLEYVIDSENIAKFSSANALTAENTPQCNGAARSGLIQFELRRVDSLPAGVTEAQMRAALMNESRVIHYLRANATTTAHSGAVNGAFGRDALFLGRSATGDRCRIYQAGFEGYVDRIGAITTLQTLVINGVTHNNVRVRPVAAFVPFGNYPATQTSGVRSVSHYTIVGGELRKIFAGNVENPNHNANILVGPAPAGLPSGVRLYSFDGVFFYTNPRNIQVNGAGALNANNPHFLYFQYLSFRSHSRVTAAQLNTFLHNELGTATNRNNSVLTNQGQHFINAQNNFGSNALLTFAKAMHESGLGLSPIARNNNNVFGQGAVDSAPGANAWNFPNVAASINDHADGWMSRGYLWTGSLVAPTAAADWRSAGPHAGHKGSGMNVFYATDPYWGLKIAGWAFRVDRTLNNQDLNREQIAILQNTSTVSVTNAAGTALYTANRTNGRFSPFLVRGTGTNNRLQIVTDSAIVNGVPNRTARFNRTAAVGYIPNSNVWIRGANAPATQPPSGGNVSLPDNIQVAAHTRLAVTRVNAPFRFGPGTSFASQRTIPAHTIVEITGRHRNWRRVMVNNQIGWIHENRLTYRTRLGSITQNTTLRGSANANGAAVRQLSRGANVVIMGVSHDRNWRRVRVGNQTGWITTPHITTRNESGRTTLSGWLRPGPRANSGRIRYINRNTYATILGASGNWTQVRIGNQTGWIATGRLN